MIKQCLGGSIDVDHRLNTKTIEVPVLYIAGRRDAVLQPSMSAGMENLIPRLTRGEVDTSHWALWEDPAGVNNLIKKWLNEAVFDAESKL